MADDTTEAAQLSEEQIEEITRQSVAAEQGATGTGGSADANGIAGSIQADLNRLGRGGTEAVDGDADTGGASDAGGGSSDSGPPDIGGGGPEGGASARYGNLDAPTDPDRNTSSAGASAGASDSANADSSPSGGSADSSAQPEPPQESSEPPAGGPGGPRQDAAPLDDPPADEATVEGESVPAGELSGQEVENLIEANKAAASGQLSEQQVEGLREQYLTNDAKTEEELARELEQQAVNQSGALDSREDVDVVRAGDGRLETRISSAGRQSLREDVAAQDPRISPSDVELSRQGGQVVAEASVEQANPGVGRGPPGGRVNTAETGPILQNLRGAGGNELANTQQQTQPRQATQADELTSPASETGRNTVSPLAGTAITDENRQQAVRGSREVARRAEDGDVAAQVAEFGRDVQEGYAGVGEAISETNPARNVGPTVGFGEEVFGRDVGVDAAPVGQQVGDFVGGAAAFPGVLAGGAAQATGAAATGGGVDLDNAGRVADAGGEALESQAEYFAQRPVEAGLIAAGAAAGSPSVRGRVSSSARAAASRGRAAARRAGERARNVDPDPTKLIADERGQVTFGRSRSRSRQQSGDQRSVPETDPVRRQATEGRRAGGRVVDDSTTTVRGQPRTLDRSQQFAQRARDIQRLRQPQAEATATVRSLDVQASEGAVGPTVVSQPLSERAETTSFDADATAEPVVTQEDVTTTVEQVQTRAQTRTQTQDRAQVEPRDPLQDPSIDRGGEQEDLSIQPRADQSTGVQERQRQAQETAVDEVTDIPSERAQDETGRSRERSRERTRERTRAATAEAQAQRERLETRSPLITGFSTRLGVSTTGGGSPGTPRPPRIPRRPPRPPGGPPGLGVAPATSLGESGPGDSTAAGDSDLTFGFLAETAATAASAGRTIPEAPAQSTLESQPFGLQATGELPTQQQVDDPDTANVFDATVSFDPLDLGDTDGGDSGGFSLL